MLLTYSSAKVELQVTRILQLRTAQYRGGSRIGPLFSSIGPPSGLSEKQADGPSGLGKPGGANRQNFRFFLYKYGIFSHVQVVIKVN